MKRKIIASIATIAIIANTADICFATNTKVYADDVVSEDVIDQDYIIDSESTITPIPYRVWDDEKKANC